MRENRNFVVPVSILTPLRAPRFLRPHDTLPCVLMTLVSIIANLNLQLVHGAGTSWSLLFVTDKEVQCGFVCSVDSS